MDPRRAPNASKTTVTSANTSTEGSVPVRPSQISQLTTSIAHSLHSVEDKLTSLMDMLVANSAHIAELKRQQEQMTTSLSQASSAVGEVKKVVSGVEKKIDAVSAEIKESSERAKAEKKKRKGFCSCLRGAKEDSREDGGPHEEFLDEYDPLVHGLREWSPLTQRRGSMDERRRTVTELSEHVRRLSVQRKQVVADLTRPP